MGYHQHPNSPLLGHVLFPEFSEVHGQECLFLFRQGQIILFLYFIHSIAGSFIILVRLLANILHAWVHHTPVAAHPLHGHVQMNGQRKHHLFLQPGKPFPGQITDIPRHAQNVVPHNRGNLVLTYTRLLEFMDMALEP